MKPNIPENEKERLEALHSYHLLDDIEQKEFNDIVKLAARICETPISLITLIDSSTQWHKARFGLDEKSMKREISFCGHAINQPDEIFIVQDATKDERFAKNPLVTGDPNIVFYAGIPLTTPEGLPLGALCVIDRVPNQLDDLQIFALKTLSGQVIRLFELLKLVKELDEKDAEIELQKQMIGNTCIDIKSYLRQIEISAEILEKQKSQLDEKGQSSINDILEIVSKSVNLIQNKNS